MRIILKDPTLVLTAVVGLIFALAMVMLLTKMTEETENLHKIWKEMSCSDLEEFYNSSEFQKLDKGESSEFKKALDACKKT